MRKAIQYDATVKACVDGGWSYEEITEALASEKAEYMERMGRLLAIAPRKVRMPNGQVLIWRCPDEDVPVTTL